MITPADPATSSGSATGNVERLHHPGTLIISQKKEGTTLYGWIWRRLPFGLPGKLIGSALLVAAAVAVLWFWVFPAAEPLLPFDDVQVTN